MGKINNIEEETLVKLLGNHDPKAIEILYDNYSSAMYGLIRRIIKNDEIAEDVLKEAFLKIRNNFSQFNASKGRLFTWMINICRNLSIDKVHSMENTNQNKSPDVEKIVSSHDFIQSSSYNPDTIIIKETVKKLETEYRMIIDLLFFEGYSQSETAEKLNIPLGTVKTRSRAALQKLKTLFQNA